MKKNLTFITIFALVLLASVSTRAQQNWYVDSTATGANDGSSWANAFRFLSDATNAARSSTTTDTIFIAKGTYYPTGLSSGTNRDSAFVFTRDNLAVLGGYPSGGATVRDWKTNRTILSGNIAGTDNMDNSYHVVAVVGASAATPISNTLVLDGLQISGGYWSTANTIYTINGQPIQRYIGAGIYNHFASPLIRNTVVSKNTRGGIYNYNSSPFITNSYVMGNDDGGIRNDSFSSPVIVGVVLKGNTDDAAINNYRKCSPLIINTTIISNSDGNAMTNSDLCKPVIKNSIIYNQPGISYYIISNYTPASPSTPVYSHSIIQNGGNSNNYSWNTYYGIDSGGNVDVDPGFIRPYYGVSYLAQDTAGYYQLSPQSPAIGMGDTTGISQYLPETDIEGNPRIQDGSIELGAYEFKTPGHIIYVDSSATAGLSSGANWANAFTSLATAVNFVAKKYSNIDTILIAKGTYYPTGDQSGTNRDSAFLITRSNLALIGGYPSGGGTRNWKTNPVILSGDIGTAGTNTDNSYHVMLAIGTEANPINNTLVFDGLNISDGYCNTNSTVIMNTQSIARNRGAGIYNRYASPKISNSSIINNKATNIGNGVGVYNAASSPLFTNTYIKGNSGGNLGVAMYNDSFAAPVIVNTVISGNSGSTGAGMYNKFASPQIINTTIASNGVGGELYNTSGSTPFIKNSIIYGSSATSTSNVNNNNSSVPTFSNSIVRGSGGSNTWNVAIGTDGGNNLDKDPAFALPSSPPSTGGNFQIQYGSPAIDAGDTTGISQYLPAIDLWDNTRIAGTQIDLGAFEFTAPAHIVYVDSSAKTGANNGTSWFDAFTSMSLATNLTRFFPAVDTILVAKGTYYPTGAQNGTNRDTAFIFNRGNLAILGGYPKGGGSLRDSKVNTTILSGNINSTTLASDNSHHVIIAAGTSASPIPNTLVIDGFTISGGNANIDTGFITVNTQQITRKAGGGMVNIYASPLLSNIIITNDSANLTGGGMYNVNSSPVITYSTINKNSSQVNGGGMYNVSSSPIITNSTIYSNSAILNGGGIFDTAASSPVIKNCVINGNKASNNGGAMYNVSASSPKISSVVFSGNSVSSNGGAICNVSGSSPAIVNTTIAGNYATNLGGGIINLSSSAPVIRNSIVYANNSGITNVSSFPVVSYSIMQDGGYPGSNNNINQDPLFQVPIVASITPTTAGDFQLLGGSPAINSGDTATVGQYTTASDLGKHPRILGSSVDRGAFEYLRTLYVDSAMAVTGSGSSWSDAYKYLSDATHNARNTNSIDTILIAKGTYFTTGSQNGTDRDTAFIYTRSGITTLGGYPNGGGTRDWVANPVTLSGNIGSTTDSTDNAYHVLLTIGSSSSPLDSTLKFDGLTIRNGNANGPSTNDTINGQLIPRREGGGVRNHYASPVMTNLLVTANYGEGGGGVFNYVSSPVMTNSTYSQNVSVSGGGISNITSSPVITNVTVINNISSFGGGIYNAVSSGPRISNCFIKGNIASSQGGGICNSQNTAALTISNTTITGNTGGLGGGISNLSGSNPGLTINNCVVSNNTATGSGGGGIYNSTSAYPVIINTRIIGNKATATGAFGGGIYNTSSTPAVRNCVITGNKAYNGGGGIYNASSSPAVITNTTISGNLATNGSTFANGGAIYNTSSNPVIRNSIISGNSTGIYNASASPNFKYSIVQGSGGSAAWVSATGVNGGNNMDVNPNFINPVSFTLAPDTTANYGITICSKAVGAGDTAGIGQTIPLSDISGNQRYIGKIDMGAYEIDTVDASTLFIPTAGGIYTSNRVFQQGASTHFCNCDSNKLLLTIDTLGSSMSFTDTAAKLKVGSAIAAYYQAGSGFVTNPDGAAFFNREWNVHPLVEPTSPVTVYSYYTDVDYNSVNNVLNSLMMTPLVADTQMFFYKVTDPALGIFPPIFSIDTDQVHIITHGAAPSVDNWIKGIFGNNKYAEYQVSSFSGGGGGATSGGNVPLSVDLLSFAGKAYNGYNHLNWQVSENIADWELSRSSNSSDFRILTKGSADITSYKDEQPLKGVNYYRLKVTTNGGQAKYSAIIALNSNSKGGGVLVYPVPATQSITVRCNNMTFIGQKGKIIDNAGKYVGSFILQQESNIDINHLAAGIYQIQLPDGSSMKIVKE